MKLKFCFLLSLCPFFGATAQVNIQPAPRVSESLAPLKTGDQVPGIGLPQVLNHQGQPLHLAGFRGKLLILDFWATTCGSCIQAMPRLDSLQRLFGDRLVILPVTSEKAAHVRAFQAHNRYLNGLKFRTVTDDRLLYQLFPHRLLPHEVWISGTGEVLGATEVTEVTAALINQVLDGGSLSVPVKSDVLDYDPAKPLLVQQNGAPDTAYRYRSLLAAEIRGLPSAISIRYDSLHQRTVIRATNVSLRRLYGLVYKDLRNLPDSSVSLGPDRGRWCYELDLPGSSATRIRQSVREDLDRFFNVSSEWSGNSFRLVPRPDAPAADEPLTL